LPACEFPELGLNISGTDFRFVIKVLVVKNDSEDYKTKTLYS
jgi:hypothetical protein